jgi:hypothetical protein
MLVGLSVALSGLSILAIAQWQQNPILAIHHWLLSNLFGCLFAVIVFIKNFNLSSVFCMRAFWWIFRLAGIIIILIISFDALEIHLTKNPIEFFALTFNFFIVCAIFLVLLFVFRLLPSPTKKYFPNENCY